MFSSKRRHLLLDCLGLCCHARRVVSSGYKELNGERLIEVNRKSERSKTKAESKTKRNREEDFEQIQLAFKLVRRWQLVVLVG